MISLIDDIGAGLVNVIFNHKPHAILKVTTLTTLSLSSDVKTVTELVVKISSICFLYGKSSLRDHDKIVSQLTVL